MPQLTFVIVSATLYNAIFRFRCIQISANKIDNIPKNPAYINKLYKSKFISVIVRY